MAFQKSQYNLLITILLVIISSCSTELDVNAPYREIKVMYGILDPNLPYQTFRISKGFLNEGRSATDIAKNSPDSILYNPDDLEVLFVEKKDNAVTRSWICYDTLITGKEDGVFYSPDQMVFRTPALTLDTNSLPRVIYTVRVSNRKTGHVSEASTNIPGKDFRVESPFVEKEEEGASFDFGSVNRQFEKILISRPINAEIVEARFNWRVRVIRDLPSGRDTTFENWLWDSPGLLQVLGSGIQAKAQGSVFRDRFLEFIKAEVQKRGNQNVVSRRFFKSTMEVFFGNKEYDNYRNVNGNYNAITQSTPVYSNVSDGLGIVCSRNSGNFPVQIDNITVNYLLDFVPELRLVK